MEKYTVTHQRSPHCWILRRETGSGAKDGRKRYEVRYYTSLPSLLERAAEDWAGDLLEGDSLADLAKAVSEVRSRLADIIRDLIPPPAE